MRFSKLIHLLHALDAPAHKQLQKYLQSPYFKVLPAETALCAYLQKLPKNFTEKNLLPAAITARCTLLKTKNAQDKAATALLKTVQQFLATEYLQHNTYAQQIAQLKALNQLQQQDLFSSHLKKARQHAAANQETDIDNLYQLHLLAEESVNGFYARQQRNNKNSIVPVLHTLDNFYALKKLRYLCEAINRQQIFNTAASITETEKLLQILQPLTTPAHPYVFLFVQVYKMQTAATYQQGLVAYTAIKKITAEQKKNNRLPQSGIEVIDYCLNFCLRWNNQGHPAAGKEFMYWLELKIKYNLLLQQNKINPSLYRNAAGIAVKSGYPLTRVHHFIEKYAQHLPTENRLSNMAYARGIYYHAQKNYTEALHQFTIAETKTEPIFNCILRRWSYMCRYQSRKTNDGLDELLQAFEKYMQRHQEELHKYKPLFNQFITYARKILFAKDKAARQKIKTALQAQEFFPGKDWLLEQV